MSAQVTLVGNVTRCELKFLPTGVPVATFGVAVNERVKRGDEWVDGEPSFFNCTVWRQAAENAAESLSKGSRVIVTGRMRQRSYETKDGEKRTVYEVEVDELGVSLRFATVSVSRVERKALAASEDPWAV